MRRKQATALIDDLRQITSQAAECLDHERELARLMRTVVARFEETGMSPLERCSGEAHSNPFIDNCSLCAPRWGWVGPVEVVS